MTLQEFGKKIKTKYPQYNDLEDIELGKKILAKYPQYQDMVDDKSEKISLNRESNFTQKATSALKGVSDFIGTTKLAEGLGLTAFKYFSPEGKSLVKNVESGKANTEELKAYYDIFGNAPTAKQTVGSALQTATSFMPAGKIGKAATAKSGLQAFGKGFAKAAVPTAAVGGAYSAGQAMTEEKGTKDILKSAAVGGAVSGIISGTIGGLFAKKQFDAPKKTMELRDKAIEQYQRGLQVTKEKYKEKSSKIVPKLLDEGMWGTFSNLKKKAASGVALSMDEYKKLGELKGIADTTGIEDIIAKEMKKYVTPGGTVVSVNKAKYKMLQAISDDIKSLKADDVVYNEELRNLAQQYGNVLYESRKAMKTINDSATLSQVKKVDGAIRELLNTTNPEYAKINKIYHLNSELQDILMETAQRKGGQKWISLTKLITGGFGGAVGSPFGVQGAVIGSLGLGGIASILESTWFNTFNALQKWRLADKISKLPMQDMPKIINFVAAGGTKAALNILGKTNQNEND